MTQLPQIECLLRVIRFKPTGIRAWQKPLTIKLPMSSHSGVRRITTGGKALPGSLQLSDD